MNIITTSELTKVYRRFEKQPGLRGSLRSLFHRQYIEKRALDGFSFEIKDGEFVGLIGPNGAGKTTLVKLLTGIIAPTSGEIDVLGFYPNALSDELKRQYAVVMGQKSQLFFELTASDTFALFKQLYNIPDAEYKRSLDYFAELFGIRALLDVQVRTLSLGERMKLELIAALLHNPRVLFLDEPTIGLDAVAQRQIREFLRDVNRERGTTIILTSHYMEDIKSLCARCIVVNGGRKIYDGATDALFERYQTHKLISISFDPGRTAPPTLPQDCRIVSETPGKRSFLIARSAANSELRELAFMEGVLDVSVGEEDIGSVVERIYAEA